MKIRRDFQRIQGTYPNIVITSLPKNAVIFQAVRVQDTYYAGPPVQLENQLESQLGDKDGWFFIEFSQNANDSFTFYTFLGTVKSESTTVWVSANFQVETLPLSSFNSKTSTSNSLYVGLMTMVAIVIVVVIVAIILLAVFIYRRKNPAADLPEVQLENVSFAESNVVTNVTLGQLIGNGHFGKVFHGKWFNNDIALKKLNFQVESQLENQLENQVEGKLWKEIRVLKTLNHPNIVRYFGIFDKDYITMEYAEKGSLQHWIVENPKRCNPLNIEGWVFDIVGGMVYLSERHIVHKDLALRNLLLFKEGDRLRAKVSDFGLSSFLDTDDYYHSDSNILLPVRWSAPEALSEKKHSSASDVWSFGIVLWEIFSYGARPYLNLTNKEVTPFVLSGGTETPPPRCSMKMAALMKKCWTRKSKERPSFLEIFEAVKLLRGGDYDVASDTSTEESISEESQF
eukprot:TRINITY_DN533_c0_g2_i1.p1 TRINITY_DN533_c0_g2~~TRINITY_DN533_c0_g2_i1.p1  ORF type:complete len:456 (+),score=188.07 TRINITY_DN533_c0_g2_i1:3-1370(+)